MERTSFREWQNILTEKGAEAAAEELYARLHQAPYTERVRAVKRLLPQEALVEAFSRNELTESQSSPDRRRNALSGVPYLLKDLFDVSGERTACSSRVGEELRSPAERDALAHAEARARGAVYVGRTHMNEFAYGLDGKNAHSGDCPHPWFPDRISGGSSSGSAWAVARGIVPLAFGTDTGGSIRVPAALSGVPGFRRPVDSWASHGVFPLARSFDTVGWFTATASDMEESIASLFGEQTEVAEDSIRGVYGEPAEVPIAGELRERYGQAVEELEMRQDADIGRAFAEIVGKTDELLESYNVIGSTEAYEVHAAWLDRHRELYDPGVWSLIDRGRHWSRADMDRARERQSTVSAALTGLFQDADALVMPAVHTVAPKHEEVDAAFRRNILALTAPASLAGLAVLTLPVFAEGGESVDAGGESVDAGAGRARLSGGLQCILAPGRETTVARRLLRRYFPKSFSM